MTDELKKIFKNDWSYEKKVEEVKKLSKKYLGEANVSFTSSFLCIGCLFSSLRFLSIFSPSIFFVFGFGILSYGGFYMFLNKKNAAINMINHIEKRKDNLFSKYNNNNNRKKKVNELEKKKKSEGQKKNIFIKHSLFFMILSFVSIFVASFICSNFVLPIGVVFSALPIPSWIKFVQSNKRQQLIQSKIDILNFDILSYEDMISKNKKCTNKNKDNLRKKNISDKKRYTNTNTNTNANAILDAYVDFLSQNGNVSENENVSSKTYSKKS